MRGRTRITTILTISAAIVASATGCSPSTEPTSSPSATSPVASSPSPTAPDLAAAEAPLRIDFAFISSGFWSAISDNPDVMPVMWARDGELVVNAVWHEQVASGAVLSAWGTAPDLACVQYVVGDVAVHTSIAFGSVKSGPCPQDYVKAGELQIPEYTQPGTYRANDIAPVKGPCFYEGTANFSGTGEGDAWIVVDCKKSDEWDWKVVGGRFITEQEWEAGIDDAYGASVCEEAWDRADEAGADEMYWSWPTDNHWSFGERGVLCTALWK